MAKVYEENPSNISDIENYILTEKEDCINAILLAEKCYFYDTCSIITHSNSANRIKIIEYLKREEGIVVLTRTVLMELANEDNIIENNNIEYFKEMFDNDISVVLLNEEYIFECLSQTISIKTEDANSLLGHAIVQVSISKGAVYEGKHDNPLIMKKLLGNGTREKSEQYTRFFQYIRSRKKSKDNLGEELMFICFIVLSRIPIGKLIFLSNDLKSRSFVIDLNDYIEQYHDKREPYQLTSASLFYNMFKEGIITDQDTMREMLDKCNDGNVTVFYKGKYDVALIEKTVGKSVLIEKIFIENVEVIY